MSENNKFDEWALLELFGHQRIAGRVSEIEIAGAGFVRVDMPAVEGRQQVTRLFGPKAIYSITPLTEETASAMAVEIDAAPMTRWDARRMLEAPVEEVY